MPRKSKPYVLPIVALIIAEICWGTNGFLIKMSLESIPVLLQFVVRFMIAGLLLLPFAIAYWKPMSRRNVIRLSISSLLFLGVSTPFFNYGLSLTTASNAAVIGLLSPVILCTLGILVLKERPQIKALLGVCISAIAAYFIIGETLHVGGDRELLGDIFLLMSTITGAIAIIINKSLLKKIPAIQLTSLSFLIGTTPLAIYAVTQIGDFRIEDVTARSWTGMILSVFAIVFANSLFFYALQSKTVQSTSVYSYLALPVAVVGSWYLLGERPTPIFFVGAALMLIGVYIVESRRVVIRRKENWSIPSFFTR